VTPSGLQAEGLPSNTHLEVVSTKLTKEIPKKQVLRQATGRKRAKENRKDVEETQHSLMCPFVM
jgi:hypothetical protein